MSTIQIKVPNCLDLIFTCPLLLYRLLRFGYTFRCIYLGEGYWTIVDLDIYYRLGNLKWVINGCGEKFYAARIVKIGPGKTKNIRLHREIMNPPPGLLVDHRNHDPLDNRRANLRLATHFQNCCNLRKRKNTSSKFKGVYFIKRSHKWCAQIQFEGKKIRLGTFDSEFDAAKAYNVAALKYHGEFASLNFPILTKSPQSPIPLRFLRYWIIIIMGCIARLVKPVRLRSERVAGLIGIIVNDKVDKLRQKAVFTAEYCKPADKIYKISACSAVSAVKRDRKMPIATFYFQLHQPFRLHPSRESFIWDEMNKQVFEKVSHKCYLPATMMFTKLIEENPKFKITLSMSGTFLEQAQMYEPEVITCLQQLLTAGKSRNQVEFLEETYYHSLSSLFADVHRQEFRDQVALHRGKMEDLFGIKPASFRNTELMFNNDIAYVVADMGYKAMLCEKRNDMFGRKNGKLVSPNAVFRAKTGNLIVIPRNRELSDDIAFRFPHTPVPAELYAKHIAGIDGEAVLLGYDYEHIGEHIWEDKGIFEFWKKLPSELAKYQSVRMANPTEVAELFKTADCPVVDIHGLSTSSWADAARDTFGWLGNNTQQEFFSRIQALEKKAKTAGGELLTKWRHLTTSDHLYFLHESTGSDQAVHSYFSPYGTIGETVRTITDKIWMLARSLEKFTILKKHTRTPVIIISPETDRLPTKGLGDFAQYVSGKSGGMGEVVAALCRGLSNRGVRTYIITLNLQRKFMEHSGMSKEEYIENLYHLPRDKIKMVDSSLFENYMSAYDGDPRATAAEFQRQIKRFLIGEILSKHEGRGIIHSHDWMAGGIITAFAKLRSIPVLHTLHNSHTGYIPLEMFGGVNLSELWSNLYIASDFGRECVDCQASAIKNAALVNYVGDRFLAETIEDYFLDRNFIPWSVRKETKAKYRYGCAFSIPNGISPSVYPENQEENAEVDKPGLAQTFGINDHVIEAKKLNLVKFQKKTGLKVDPEVILLYWPSRLDRVQKGIELLEDIALRFVIEHPDVQIAVVGNPVGDDRNDADILGKIACASGGKITYWPFNDDLSTLGYAAASDVFGASLYEPFGQIDLVGNLFGATATNRNTGGFHDKIVPLQLRKMGGVEDVGNGVLFENYDAGGLWYGLELTVQNHRFFRKDQAEWEKQVKRIMRDARNNWGLNKMMAGYLGAYERILGYPVV